MTAFPRVAHTILFLCMSHVLPLLKTEHLKQYHGNAVRAFPTDLDTFRLVTSLGEPPKSYILCFVLPLKSLLS